MSSKETGGPAFPSSAALDDLYDEEGNFISADGATMRDYFAARAMQSLLMVYDREISEGGPGFDVCERAYRIADRMLEVRK